MSLIAPIVLAAAAVAAGGRETLHFAWPAPAEARVEVTDERVVGDQARTIVLTLRLRVEPIGENGHLLIRLSDPELRSINGTTVGDTDPGAALLATGRVMKAVTPAMVIDREGRFLALASKADLVSGVLEAAELPAVPQAAGAFAALLSDVAEEDWHTWAGAWVGAEAPAENGLDPVRLQASAIEDTPAVRTYVAGLLIDMAREAKELGDDPATSARFLERATYSPVTIALRAELERTTMRPLLAERVRTFYAVAGKHRVDGRERRTHRFTWTAP